MLFLFQEVLYVLVVVLSAILVRSLLIRRELCIYSCILVEICDFWKRWFFK